MGQPAPPPHEYPNIHIFRIGHDGQKQIIWWKINIPVWLATINDTKTHNTLLYPPYECTRGGGGYYGLVVVAPPRRRPETLHRLRDNLKNLYRIASIFYIKIDIFERIAGKQVGPSLIIYGPASPPPPTNSQTFTFFALGPYMTHWWLFVSLFIHLSALWRGLIALKIW